MPESQRRANRVRLDIDLIPDVIDPMPVLRQAEPAVASQDFVSRLVNQIAPGAEVKRYERGLTAHVNARGRLAALTDPGTGETRAFPSLESLVPTGGLARSAGARARQVIDEAGLFPRDDTSVVPLRPLSLLAAHHPRNESAAEPLEHLSFQRFRRHVAGVPVFGPGTRATIALGADDTVHGLAHRWRPATLGRPLVKPRPKAEIARTIVHQLASGSKHGLIDVDRVSLAYYDGGKDFLQPVYRFCATISDREVRGEQPGAANRHLMGFVSIGEPPEELPVLGGRAAVRPRRERPRTGRALPPPPNDPTVGRYVVRNDDDEWVDSANEFLGGLRLAEAWGSPRQFTDAQYYWAHPWQFTTAKDSRVNSVHIALIEVHGNWWNFWTSGNSADGVALSDIPSPGYGPGPGGGSLGYWIIHSCEVIPTQTDESTSFDVWWQIFNGLHAVAGYRTEMWIDDDVTGSFAVAIGFGAPVVSAWLNEVASNDSYDDGDTYHDGNRDIDEPMGRASAVAVCGHGDDTVDDTATTGTPDCLTEWWFNN